MLKGALDANAAEAVEAAERMADLEGEAVKVPGLVAKVRALEVLLDEAGEDLRALEVRQHESAVVAN